MAAELNLRKILLDELKNANQMLAKYETKLLEGSPAVDEKPYIQERVKYWSETASITRKQLFDTKSDVNLS
jgi:hypothetical protein